MWPSIHRCTLLLAWEEERTLLVVWQEGTWVRLSQPALITADSVLMPKSGVTFFSAQQLLMAPHDLPGTLRS